MEMNNEDIPNSLPDVLKREIGLTKRELNLNPQGIQGALNLLSTLRLNRVKKEEDIIRVLEDVLEELLNKVIPWTEQILKVIQGGQKTEGLIEWLFPNPGAESFFSGYMLYHVQGNILNVEKISSKLVIRLNLANEVLNYLSSIDRARRRTWRMYELYLRGGRSMVGSLPVGFILSAHKTTQTALSFFEEYGDSIFFELNVEMKDIIKRFVQNLELSKTMLPKLKEADSLERIEKMLQEMKDNGEPKKEEEWLSLSTLSIKYFDNISVPQLRRAIKVAGLQPGVAGHYPKSEVMKAMKNYRHKNTRKAYEANEAEKKQAAAPPKRKKRASPKK